MSLLGMSFSASIIIIVVILLRTLLLHKLPKKVFLILWSVALLRLLVPFSVPSTFSVYFLISQNSSIMNKIADTSIVDFLPFHSYGQKEKSKTPENEKESDSVQVSTEHANTSTEQSTKQDSGKVNQIETERQNEKQKNKIKQDKQQKKYKEQAGNPIREKGYLSGWTMVWIIGMFVCMIIFSVIYVLCCRQFYTSLPIENALTKEWLISHRTRRTISIRQSDRISTPLAYGFFHPVILMPKTTKWENSRQLQYILEHEFIHIKRLDAITKLFLIAAVCVHWFNPLVWIMYIVANRDIELSCDEAVVRHFGEGSKSAYALALICMEETKSRPMPLASDFGRDVAEERITAIMRIRKPSLSADILAVCLVVGVTAAFATSAFAADEQKTDSIGKKDAPIAQNTVQSAEEGQMFSLLQPENNMELPSLVLSEEKQTEIFLNSLNVETATTLSEEQQKELLNEYQKYGVYENNSVLYYQDKPIRCLIDKYEEETRTGYGGKNINTIRIYTYFNQNGVVDVNAIREYKIGKTEIIELYRDVMDMTVAAPVSVYDIIVDLPQKSVNKLAWKAAREGRYRDLEKVAPFADTEIMDEIAEKMLEKGIKLDRIAGTISTNCLDKLAKLGYQKWGFSFLKELLPFLSWESVDRFASIAAKNKNYYGMKIIEDFKNSIALPE